jgi:V/A-type H+-transporting ATPase subunit K
VNSDSIFLGLGYIGLIATMGFGIIGSCIGCAIAGLAADGAMLETETGHGRFLGVVAMPSSQSIYGIVLMFILRGSVSPATGVGRAWYWSTFRTCLYVQRHLSRTMLRDGN